MTMIIVSFIHMIFLSRCYEKANKQGKYDRSGMGNFHDKEGHNSSSSPSEGHVTVHFNET